jgi:hypothetical protein
MNALHAAGFLLIGLAVVHSVAGELLILRHRRKWSGVPPVLGMAAFPTRSLHMTWHLASVMGLCLAAILLHLAGQPTRSDADRFVIEAIAAGMLGCGVVAALLTRGTHPGWIAFVAAAGLCWLSR